MDYVPILRFRPVEFKILQKTSHSDIFPLLETVDKKSVSNVGKLKGKFAKGMMIELPCYLTENENKYFGGVMSVLQGYDGNTKTLRQVAFYKANKGKIDIPVVSSGSARLISYKDLLDGFDELKDSFERIAVRIFVGPIDISSTNMQNLMDLIKKIRKSDIILLDVVEFDGVEVEVMNNIKKVLNAITEEKKANVIVLNAFDATGEWKNDVHHYAPLLAKIFGLSGFGDFVTLPRYESAGGSNVPTSVIRYFSPWESKLIHFVSSSNFRDSKRKLKNSTIWKIAVTNRHFSACDSCVEIDKKDSEWKTFWKIFRINHHINSIMSETMQAMGKYQNPQDFDMEGYNNIFKKTNQK